MRLHQMQSTFRRQSFSVRLWVYVILLGLYAGVAVAKEYSPLDNLGDAPANLHAVLGVVLSLLMVFRTNTAYDRWWEGRKLWGQLLNDSRTLIVKVKHLSAVNAREKDHFTHLVISVVHSLRDHLRGPVNLQNLPGFEKWQANPRHVPAYLISLIYERLSVWREQGQIDGFTALMLDRHASAYSDIVGACERIRNTPLSESYRIYVRLCMIIYLVSLPWGLVEQLKAWTIPVTMMTSYFMLGLEMIARAVEDPFGTEADDLPLDDLSHNNEMHLHEILDLPTSTPPGSPEARA